VAAGAMNCAYKKLLVRVKMKHDLVPASSSPTTFLLLTTGFGTIRCHDVHDLYWRLKINGLHGPAFTPASLEFSGNTAIMSETVI
jgi:hypothetical protein